MSLILLLFLLLVALVELELVYGLYRFDRLRLFSAILLMSLMEELLVTVLLWPKPVFYPNLRRICAEEILSCTVRLESCGT